jgi:isopenicillin-N epimerase
MTASVERASSVETTTLRDDFLLDPEVVFLNHGSFGACPRPVFEEYQRWQRELEWQPVEFLGRRADDLLNAARARLAAYVNVDPDCLVFVPNATSGLNIVARSFPLEPGDEVVGNTHEYGALDLTWEHVCRKAGATYKRQEIPAPLSDPAEIVEAIWSGVTPRTKVVFLSHITSPSALIFPVAEVCRRAREAGIFSMVDGAHAPGQIPLDLDALGADVYSGNCHKWLCAPKGSAFLHVRPEHQRWVEALIVSWGWREADASFVKRNQWQGTREIASFLSVPAAIDYQAAHDWPAVRARCHALASECRRRLSELTGLPPICPDSPDWFAQMIASPLPSLDGEELKRRLYDEFRIEVPLHGSDEGGRIRVSFQAYNSEADLDRLLEALTALGVGRA